MDNSQAMLRFVLMLALAYAVLLAASVRFGPLYSAAWLPLFQWQMERVAPDYKVVTLHVVERQRQRVIEAVIETVRPVRIGGTIIPAGASVTASTVIGNQLLHSSGDETLAHRHLAAGRITPVKNIGESAATGIRHQCLQADDLAADPGRFGVCPARDRDCLPAPPSRTLAPQPPCKPCLDQNYYPPQQHQHPVGTRPLKIHSLAWPYDSIVSMA